MNTLLTSIYLQPLLAFALGLFAAWICFQAFEPTRSTLISCALLPPVVCTALLAVNGSVGTSIAVLGVFGLVRFRSLPGKSSDMVCILYVMVIGLLVSTGNWIASIILTLLLGVLLLGVAKILVRSCRQMELLIVVPESMPEEPEYKALVGQYGSQVRLERMKSAGMGTLYELAYRFSPDPNADFSRLLDEIRQRNGNLAVTLIELHENDGTF